MSAHTVKILLGVILALLDLTVLWIALNPQKPTQKKLARILYFAIGPKTQTSLMTRSEMFKASFSFFLWFLHVAVINYYIAGFLFKGNGRRKNQMEKKFVNSRIYLRKLS